MTTIKDSGERQNFPTGSVRDTRRGKGRFDLLPVDALFELARVYEGGAEKYDARNWEKGQPLSRYLDSALRHTFEALRGDHDENHAAQAAWNILAFIQTRAWIESGRLPIELDDLPTAETVRRVETECQEGYLEDQEVGPEPAHESAPTAGIDVMPLACSAVNGPMRCVRVSGHPGMHRDATGLYFFEASGMAGASSPTPTSSQP
jgi:dATP/dGTP diphosphohydrolase, N-terminal